MKIEGSDLIPAEPGLLWPLLQDANALRRIIPGTKVLNHRADSEYRAEVQQRLGPYDDLFGGTLHLSEKDPASCLRIIANLESPHGMVRITGDIALEEAGDNSTLLHYEGDVELGGRLTAVPPRLLETTANAFIRQALDALERETAGPQPFVMRRALAGQPSEPSERSLSSVLLPWIVPAFLAAASVIVLRLLDNRRINRLGETYIPSENPTGTGQS
ncbi:MAG: SRPBCC domain-containing protein [Chloroflexota bacterium]